MRELTIGLLLGIPGLAMAVELWYAFQLRGFPARVPAVRTAAERDELEALERLAANLAALLKPALSSTGVIFLAGLLLDWLELFDLLYAITPNIPLLLIGLWLKPIEQRAKALKASSQNPGLAPPGAA